MGNGESTAKRISMQKTDEGSVQISEEVMKRLKKHKNSESSTNEPEENKNMIKEENVKLLLKNAYEKGKSVGERKALEQIQAKNEEEGSHRAKEAEEFRNFTNKEIEDLQKQLEETQLLLKSQSEEKERLLQAASEQISEEKKDKDELMKKLDTKEESLKVEFTRGVEDIEKIIRPLQSKVVLCEELQNEVIDCYRDHRYHPLRCSKIVTEYRKCVNEAKLRQMEVDGS